MEVQIPEEIFDEFLTELESKGEVGASYMTREDGPVTLIFCKQEV